MKVNRDIEFNCNHCEGNITGLEHIRILLGFTSGWMIPPFTPGKASIELCDRNPEYHFCTPQCFAEFFKEKLYAIRTDSPRDVERSDGSSTGTKMLERNSPTGSSVSG